MQYCCQLALIQVVNGQKLDFVILTFGLFFFFFHHIGLTQGTD